MIEAGYAASAHALAALRRLKKAVDVYAHTKEARKLAGAIRNFLADQFGAELGWVHDRATDAVRPWLVQHATGLAAIGQGPAQTWTAAVAISCQCCCACV